MKDIIEGYFDKLILNSKLNMSENFRAKKNVIKILTLFNRDLAKVSFEGERSSRSEVHVANKNKEFVDFYISFISE